MYVKNTAFKQCQIYMVFYLYENLPNKLTYGKEPGKKKNWTVYYDSVKYYKCLPFKKIILKLTDHNNETLRAYVV